MGLLSGTAGFVRYSVEGELPGNFWDFAAGRISDFAFRDIDDGFEEYSIGWVSVHNMFDSAFAFASYAVGDNIVLALRIDERKVSPAVLKKFVLKEEERIKKELEVPRLSRARRQEIKENVRLGLVKRAVPVPGIYELWWNLADNTVYFFSNQPKIQAVLEDFFRQCFELDLVLQVPYLTAAHLLPPDQTQRLEDLRPALFI